MPGKRKRLPEAWEKKYLDSTMAVAGTSYKVLRIVGATPADLQTHVRGLRVTFNPAFAAQPSALDVANMEIGFIKVTREIQAYDAGEWSESEVAAAAARRPRLLHKSFYLALNYSNQPIYQMQYGGFRIAEGEALYIAARSSNGAAAARIRVAAQWLQVTRRA